MFQKKSKTPAEVIRLNAQGWYVEKIATHFNWTPQTVREVLHKTSCGIGKNKLNKVSSN
jgi:DNA-binding NarL/FixJ family response regulator